jgi:hypothetical protein
MWNWQAKVIRIDVVAAQESGRARATQEGMVILKKLLYHLRGASDPLISVMAALKITNGKHTGTTNQLIPPCPE